METPTMNMEDMKRSRRRTAHPLLLLMQRGSYRARKSELLRQKCKDGECSLSSTDEGMNKWKEAHSGAQQECCQLSPGGEASFECFWLESGSPSISEKSASWIGKVTNSWRMSGSLSRGPSFSSDLSRRQSLSKLSSSCTSWTKPFADKHVSDSYCPASSILDNDDNDDIDDKDVNNLDDNVLQNDINQRRKSSADTCNDIDDIEDFELDNLNDCDITDEDDLVFEDDEPMKEGDNKRQSGVMSSPDMAYGSMDGSFDHQDGA